ncbi:MAG: iron-containing alcohol dehydrogenase [Anaerolineales bacterium]|jgi:alcohol dehydrogenase class IV
MHFEFATSSRILFGTGSISEVPALAASLGQRAFFITDSLERSSILRDSLISAGLSVEFLLIKQEPVLDIIVMATRNFQATSRQVVIGFGGGSALDTGKAIAALLQNPGDPLAFLEVVGSGKPLQNPSTPFIAIPTTAGTGSEVTRNAVISLPEKRIKVSLRSPYMLPRIAVIDPALSYSLPPSITASTGLDALTQLIEPFVCISPSPLTDTFCRDGILRAARSLHTACQNGKDAAAREDMALASLFGGLALANARLGAVHGMANPIGGYSRAPHGAVCARLLALVMETNLNALRTRLPASPAIARYTEEARLLTGDATAMAEAGVDWVRQLCNSLKIKPLKEYGLNPDDFLAVVAQSQKANSMKGNPVSLTDSELLSILESAYAD